MSAQRSRGELCLLWYNVENLFHPANDSLLSDDEFTPEGLRHWTRARYQNKLSALAKVIIAAGGWEPPELVGLCEVEEASVLEDLVSHPILEPYHYAFIHRNSPDHRGLDVACLYRPGRIRITGWRAITSRMAGDGTRDMLHLSLSFGKRDSLELFLVHLISKYRGAGATAEKRRIQVAHLAHCIDSVQTLRSHSTIVAAGDFNDAPDSYSLEPLSSPGIGKDPLLWVSPELPLQVEGTYKYRGQWSHLDQVRWSGGAGPFELSATVLSLPPLMTTDEEYGALKPLRTYVGFNYQGGLSDHLPLVLLLRRTLLQHPAER